jgi:hypothetical protein
MFLHCSQSCEGEKETRRRTAIKRGMSKTPSKPNPPYVILVGSNGTGKSTKMRQMMSGQPRNLILPSNMADSEKSWGDISQVLKPELKWIKGAAPPGKKQPWVKIYTFPGLKTFKGNAKIHLDDLPEDDAKVNEQHLFQAVLKDYRNGGIFMDDYRNYIKSNSSLPNYVSRIFRNRRHVNLSIYMASHHYADVNGELLNFSPVIAMCRVGRKVNEAFMDKVPDQKSFKKAFDYVQSKSRTNEYFCLKYKIDE